MPIEEGLCDAHGFAVDGQLGAVRLNVDDGRLAVTYYALFRKDDERTAICQTKKLIRDILDERRTRCAPDSIASDGTPLARAFTQPLPTSWETEDDAGGEAVLSTEAIAWQEQPRRALGKAPAGL